MGFMIDEQRTIAQRKVTNVGSVASNKEQEGLKPFQLNGNQIALSSAKLG